MSNFQLYNDTPWHAGRVVQRNASEIWFGFIDHRLVFGRECVWVFWWVEDDIQRNKGDGNCPVSTSISSYDIWFLHCYSIWIWFDLIKRRLPRTKSSCFKTYLFIRAMSLNAISFSTIRDGHGLKIGLPKSYVSFTEWKLAGLNFLIKKKRVGAPCLVGHPYNEVVAQQHIWEK